jgi:DNA modification methylase
MTTAIKKEVWNINKLHEWDKNPRSINKKDFERLKKQIVKLGQYKPLLITPDGEVIGGNMRLKAYSSLGIEDIWVSIVTPKDEAEKLEYALSDNDRAGYYDVDMIANMMPEYPEFNWGDYAVDLKEPQTLKDLIDSLTPIEEDEVPEVSDEPAISKLGEGYQLGRHRLMCGDSTKIEDVEKLMDGKKADMVFTDPPYGIDYQDLKGKFKKIANDNTNPTQLIQDSLSPHFGIPTYVCCNWRSMKDTEEAMKNAGLEVKACIVWDKGSGVQNLDKFYKRHEFILYSGPYGGEKTVDGDVWQITREVRNDHPTAKPVELCARAIKYQEGNNVIDMFGGSGSTLIACEQTNRICYMMEIDEKYCDVIRKRYAKFIGKEEEWETL